jgi:hypothetical protein
MIPVPVRLRVPIPQRAAHYWGNGGKFNQNRTLAELQFARVMLHKSACSASADDQRKMCEPAANRYDAA